MISSLYHYGLFDQIECEQGGANYVLSDFAKALKSSSLNFDEGFYTEKRILTYNDIKPLNIAEPYHGKILMEAAIKTSYFHLSPNFHIDSIFKIGINCPAALYFYNSWDYSFLASSGLVVIKP